MSRPIARKATLASSVAADLRAAILRGDLPPDSKINLDRLRETYAISISPLREAVSRLLQDGLVTFEDQRGYSVAPVSSADLGELTRLRAEVDSLALIAAISAGTLEWESAVMSALYRLSRTPISEADDWTAAHSAFHMALLTSPNHPRTTRLCTTLRAHQDRYRSLFLPASAQDEAEHTALAHAATSRQTARATALLRAHIETNHAHILARMPPD